MAEAGLKLLEFTGRALDNDFGLNLVPFSKNHKVNSSKFRDTEAECIWKAGILDTYEAQGRYFCKRPLASPNGASHQTGRLEDEVASGERVQVEMWSQDARTCGKKRRLRTMRLVCLRREERGWLNSSNEFSRRGFCLFHCYIFLYPDFFLTFLPFFTHNRTFAVSAMFNCTVWWH